MRSALIALTVATAACGVEASEDPYVTSAAGLCEAAGAADRSDFGQAEETFYDTVHQPLHDLAAAVAQVDRAIAAVLLEAKESVESGFDNDDPGLAGSLQRLVAATDDALRSTGHRGVPCAADSS